MIEMNKVSFSYVETEQASLKNISLSIPKGECVLLTGGSGCGKTTITRLLNGLIPNYYDGVLEGEVLIDGKNVKTLDLYETAGIIGSVFQNPKSQFFNSDVKSELAFVCENMGMPNNEIEQRVKAVVHDFSIQKFMGKAVNQLSGGEKQRLACATVSAPNPSIYVLDEPSSNLDTSGIMLLRDSIHRLKEKGKTIIIAEHRLHYLKEVADRVLLIENGEITADMNAQDFFSLTKEKVTDMGLRCTSLDALLSQKTEEANLSENKLIFNDFSYSHKGQKECINIDELKIPKSSITAIIGENGAGKSTFAKCLCGIYKNCGLMILDKKKMQWRQRLSSCYMVMQDVNHQLFTESVLDEILISMEEENEDIANDILKDFDLLDVADRHPISLSGGQKQRTAIATAVVSNRNLIVFDEPTSGLDYKHMKEVSKQLQLLAQKGKTLMVITHDPELILDCCNFIVELKGGLIHNSYSMRHNEHKLLDYFIKGGVNVG